MAYIKGYKYDIFISYSHLDNQKVFHQQYGWIEEFFTELNALLSRSIGLANAVNFWWDNKKLDGSMEFDDCIDEAIKESAIMICLVSRGYLQSEYCNRELELFYNKASEEPAGLAPNNRSRILNVLLYNIGYSEWPKELNGRTGFKFNDGNEQDDLGDPVEAGSEAFKNSLKDLRDVMLKLIAELRLGPPPIEGKFAIFFGDVSDSLRQFKKRTITELKSLKSSPELEIISDIPPPYEDDEHEEIVKQRLKQAKLSIHLLDQYPGREIEGEETKWYPQKQVELCLESPQTQLIWVPLDINIDEVEDEKYKLFLQNLETGKTGNKNIKYIRGIKSELTKQIIDITNQVQTQQKAPSKEKISILLDTHYNDQLYALELSKYLIENGVQPYINPEEDDPRKNISILEDRISQVSKLVFFYGTVSSYWITERINAAMQFIVSNKYPKKDFYILMIPPQKKTGDMPPLDTPFLPINIINSSDTSQVDSVTFQQFFKSINATA